jgi:hypothetical protein
VTYRTPDYMLSSAQDYRPGEAGAREHVWQATLGPDAIVYVTHPANAHVGDARAPGFWVGNRSLPRAAQWKDTLVAVYSLPEDDWMGFTHAYWPAYAFDESEIRDGWAFARVGDGYVALTAAAGIEPVHSGPGAYHELRSYGQRNTWVCLMGRRAVDGSFEAFQEAVLALDIDLGQDGVQLRTLRGEQLSFGWRGALRIDGSSKAIAGFKHYECPYATVEMARRTPAPMDIRHGDRQLRLTFAAAR